MRNLIETFDISADGTRVGVIVYSDEPKLEIALNNYFDKTELLDAIQEWLKSRPGIRGPEIPDISINFVGQTQQINMLWEVKGEVPS